MSQRVQPNVQQQDNLEMGLSVIVSEEVYDAPRMKGKGS